MELTIQQITFLLEVAKRSPFTAEQIASLVIERQNEEVLPTNLLPTVRELFTEENIYNFTSKKHMVRRTYNVVNNCLDDWLDLTIDMVVFDRRVPVLARWSKCGKKTQDIIRSMFESYGCKIR